MEIKVRKYEDGDIADMVRIWNQVVEDGVAFPQEDFLTEETGREFFARQDTCGAAVNETGRVVGMYILHPNNIGRCGHLANASYAVSREERGAGVGRALVEHSLKTAKEMGYRIMQFNAVVRSNLAARNLYLNMGFIPLGTIFDGFRMKDGTYEAIVPYYYDLTKEQNETSI